MHDASRWSGLPARARWSPVRRAPWQRQGVAETPDTRARPRSLVVAGWVIAGVNLLAIGVLVADLAGWDAPDPVPALPVWLVIAAFSLVELAVIRLEIGGQPVALALRATPTLAGLAYLAPSEVVAAHVIGTTVAILLRDRPSMAVAAVVIVGNALGTALAAVLFQALVTALGGTAVGWWLAGSAVMVVANGAGTVGALVRWAPPGRPLRVRSLAPTIAFGTIASVVDASLAVTVVIYLRSDPSELLLLAGPVLLSVAAYRAWSRLRRRHERVEYLYACGRLLEGPSSGAAMLDELLELTRDIVSADRAEILLDEPGNRRLGASVGPGPERQLLAVVTDTVPVERGDLVPAGDRGVLLNRGGTIVGQSAAVGTQDAIIVRIDGGPGVTGTLTAVGRRHRSRFGRDQVRLLESMAVSLGTTLGSRRMAEELRASLTELAEIAQLTALTPAPLQSTEASVPSLLAMGQHARPVPSSGALAMGIIDTRFTWRWVNDALCGLLDEKAGDLVGRRFEVMVARDDIEPAHGLVSRMLRGESRGSTIEIRLLRPDSRQPAVATFSVRPLRPGGTDPQAICVLEDVTAAREAEERSLRIEQRAQEAILELTAIREPAAVLRALVDAARDVTDARAAAVLAPGPHGEPMLPRGDAQGAAARSLLLDPGHRSLQVAMSPAAGGSLYLLREAGARPFTDEDEALARRLVSQAEVSLENADAHQRALALVGELDDANVALQAASAARSRFLANVSHELRTPLHAILISAELMADPSTAVRDPDRALKLPSTIGRTGRHLLALIEDLVDLSRMELHDLRMDLVPMDLGPAIADAIGHVVPLADERGIDLSYTGGDGVRVRADPKRLRQVLVNLLGNAIKYTPSGGKVRLTAESRWHGLRLSVLDTGIGIDPEDLERAFEPFERVSQLGTTGAGLGLPIARRIMELHGGTLTATSMPGLGSVFTAWVPAEAILPAVSEPSRLHAGSGATAATA